jgi:uncharacterized protein YbaP (TraB family)
MRLALLVLLLLAGSLHAAQSPAVLWSVRGTHNVVYLAGSIHFLPDSATLPPAMLEAYREAEKLVMELDLDDLDPSEVQMLMLQQGMLPPDRTLEDDIGAEAFARVRDEANDIGLDAAILQRMRPWLAAMTLTQLRLAKLGWSPTAGVEQRFVRMAAEDRKEIIGLETASAQLGLLASLPDRLQREFVLYTLDEAESMAQAIDALGRAWREGDTATLENLLNEGFRRYPELYEPLTVQRNRAWMEQLEPLLREREDYLVVVGAAHLLGRDSVVELLRRSGYQVTRH